MEPDEIDARCYEEWVKRRPLTDYRVPRHSLIKGDKVHTMVTRNLPGLIEELEHDFFCVAGDLVSGELVVQRRGSLADAVCASMALPGLGPPQIHGERMLFDGGVLNNMPVDVMAQTDEGPVIAVNVAQQFEAPGRLVDGAMPSRNGNGGLRRRLRRAPDEPESELSGFVDTLTRSLLLGSADAAELGRRYADLVIAPENDGVGLLEFRLRRAQAGG